ncbi:MAG: hypothetical protein KGK08_08510 [Acidobacteriota bacterium]|nr:hypothetical protein [Acidobacteriota bacterium]
MHRAILATLVLALTAVAPAATPLAGTFSMQGGTRLTDGHLVSTPLTKDGLRQHLDLWMTQPNSTQAIRNYTVEMTKKLHVVLVKSDFSVFLHIHPTLGATGHFTIDQQFPSPGLYYVYADGLPNDMDHQVFRFNLAISSSQLLTPQVAPTGREVNVGPYTVDLSQVRLSAGGMDMIDVRILKGDKPATDLHPYLGAGAHAVFLNARDLTYVHVHPMLMDQPMPAMSGSGPMRMGPELPENATLTGSMMLHISVHEPGTYKMWFQFRGGNQLYVAPFVLTAQ